MPVPTAASQPEIMDCPVCFCPVVESVDLTCGKLMNRNDPEPNTDILLLIGHSYCSTCFLHQVQAPWLKDIPLKCCGNDNTCTCAHAFSINLLRSVVPFAPFEALLESSFDTHVRTHPEELRYCPAENCTAVFQPTTSALITCSSCLNCICTTCRCIYHRGQSCAEYVDMRNNPEGLRQYYQEHDVSECPACSMRMFRAEWCAHIICLGCEAHVCWGCMQVFPDEDRIYAHMRRCANAGEDMIYYEC